MRNGSGCKTCPVNPCQTLTYRGSTCAAQRAAHGLGDPKTNADRIRDMLDKNDAQGLLDTFEELFEDGVPGPAYMLSWLTDPNWRVDDGA